MVEGRRLGQPPVKTHHHNSLIDAARQQTELVCWVARSLEEHEERLVALEGVIANYAQQRSEPVVVDSQPSVPSSTRTSLARSPSQTDLTSRRLLVQSGGSVGSKGLGLTVEPVAEEEQGPPRSSSDSDLELEDGPDSQSALREITSSALPRFSELNAVTDEALKQALCEVERKLGRMSEQAETRLKEFSKDVDRRLSNLVSIRPIGAPEVAPSDQQLESKIRGIADSLLEASLEERDARLKDSVAELFEADKASLERSIKPVVSQEMQALLEPRAARLEEDLKATVERMFSDRISASMDAIAEQEPLEATDDPEEVARRLREAEAANKQLIMNMRLLHEDVKNKVPQLEQSVRELKADKHLVPELQAELGELRKGLDQVAMKASMGKGAGVSLEALRDAAVIAAKEEIAKMPKPAPPQGVAPSELAMQRLKNQREEAAAAAMSEAIDDVRRGVTALEQGEEEVRKAVGEVQATVDRLEEGAAKAEADKLEADKNAATSVAAQEAMKAKIAELEREYGFVEDRLRTLDGDLRERAKSVEMKVNLIEATQQAERDENTKARRQWNLSNQVDVIQSVVVGEMKWVKDELGAMMKEANHEAAKKLLTPVTAMELKGRASTVVPGAGKPSETGGEEVIKKEVLDKIKRLQEGQQHNTLQIAGLKAAIQHAEQEADVAIRRSKKLAEELESTNGCVQRQEGAIEFLVHHSRFTGHEGGAMAGGLEDVPDHGASHGRSHSHSHTTPRGQRHKGPLRKTMNMQPLLTAGRSKEVAPPEALDIPATPVSPMAPGPLTPQPPSTPVAASPSPLADHGQPPLTPRGVSDLGDQPRQRRHASTGDVEAEMNTGRIARLGKRLNEVETDLSGNMSTVKEDLFLCGQKLQMLIAFLPRRQRRLVDKLMANPSLPQANDEAGGAGAGGRGRASKPTPTESSGDANAGDDKSGKEADAAAPMEEDKEEAEAEGEVGGAGAGAGAVNGRRRVRFLGREAEVQLYEVEKESPMPWQLSGEPDQKWQWCLNHNFEMGRDLARHFEQMEEERGEFEREVSQAIEKLKEDIEKGSIAPVRGRRRSSGNMTFDDSEDDEPSPTRQGSKGAPPLLGSSEGMASISDFQKVCRRIEKHVMPMLAHLEERLEKIAAEAKEMRKDIDEKLEKKADKEEFEMIAVRMAVFDKFEPKVCEERLETLETAKAELTKMLLVVGEQVQKLETVSVHKQEMKKMVAEVSAHKVELKKEAEEMKEMQTSIFNGNRTLTSSIHEAKTALERQIADLAQKKVGTKDIQELVEKVAKMDDALSNNRQILSANGSSEVTQTLVRRVVLNIEDKLMLVEKKIEAVAAGKSLESLPADAGPPAFSPGGAAEAAEEQADGVGPSNEALPEAPKRLPVKAAVSDARGRSKVLGEELAGIESNLTQLRQEIQMSQAHIDYINEQGQRQAELAERMSVVVASTGEAAAAAGSDGEDGRVDGTTLSLNRVQVMIAAAARQLVAGSKWITKETFDLRLTEFRREYLAGLRQAQELAAAYSPMRPAAPSVANAAAGDGGAPPGEATGVAQEGISLPGFNFAPSMVSTFPAPANSPTSPPDKALGSPSRRPQGGAGGGALVGASTLAEWHTHNLGGSPGRKALLVTSPRGHAAAPASHPALDAPAVRLIKERAGAAAAAAAPLGAVVGQRRRPEADKSGNTRPP